MHLARRGAVSCRSGQSLARCAYPSALIWLPRAPVKLGRVARALWQRESRRAAANAVDQAIGGRATTFSPSAAQFDNELSSGADQRAGTAVYSPLDCGRRAQSTIAPRMSSARRVDFSGRHQVRHGATPEVVDRSGDEERGVPSGATLLQSLVDKLRDVPTPGWPTPRQLKTGAGAL